MNTDADMILAKQAIVNELGLGLDGAGDNWINTLAAEINRLITCDFQRLVHILYRIDIDEGKLRTFLRAQDIDAGMLIARLIIDRQIQKIESRRKFSKDAGSTSEEERWS